MEVVAIEGSLTDFEVLELLQSPVYSNVVDFSAHQANRRQLQMTQKKHDTKIAPFEKKLQQLQVQFNAGEISEAEFRQQCSHIMSKTSRVSQQLSAVRSEISYTHKLESAIYVRSKLLKYLQVQACRDQTHDHLAQFFTALATWQAKWYLTLEPSEITMLINLRPTTETLLPLVLNGYFDRIPQAEARDELVELIQILPPAPPLEFDQDAVADGEAGDAGEEDGEDEIDDGEAVAEDDFDTSFAAQRDQDDDGANDSE